MPLDGKNGQFTFRITAVFFVLSAVLELLSIGSKTLLFGEMRGGAAAGIYYLAYVALFTALGISLWSGKKWGYALVFVNIIICTLDDLQYLLSRQTYETFLANQMADYGGVLQSYGINLQLIMQSYGIDLALIMQVIVLGDVVIILFWWSFALYTYRRRGYFKSS